MKTKHDVGFYGFVAVFGILCLFHFCGCDPQLRRSRYECYEKVKEIAETSTTVAVALANRCP